MALPTGTSPDAYLPTHIRRELNLVSSVSIGEKSKRAKYVQECMTLAGFPVMIDGDFGPATEQQLKNFQTSKGLPVSGVYTQATHDVLALPFAKALGPVATGGKTLGEVAVAVGRLHVKQKPREAGGDNRGPWVRMYMGGNEGTEWKWCAGYIFLALAQAAKLKGVPLPMNSTYSCDVIAERAKTLGKFVKESAIANGTFPKSDIAPGSFFLVRRTSTDWTHTGIVVEANADSFVTLEGNTNDDGSANGFEAVERVRGYDKKDFVVW